VKALTKKTRLRKAVRKNFGRRKGKRSRANGASKTGRDLVSASALRTAVEDAVQTRQELAAELAEMVRLHQLSTRLFGSTALQPLLDEILHATMALLKADFGNVQLYDPKTKGLEIVAHRGFRREFLDYFNRVHEGTGSCGAALKGGKRVIVEDVLAEPAFAPHLKIVAAAGYRAVQSTPLFSRSGEPLGMISTHFRKPHRPSQRELRFVDLYARQAAEVIERKRAEDALRASEERFRRYFDLGLIGMAITSPSKGILEVNDELCRILGYDRDELLQKTWAELTHPDDLPRDVANFERVVAGEIDGYSLEKRWIRKDGQIINGVMAAKCHRRRDGSVDYFVGLLQDISERKRAQDAERKAHERIDLIMASISDQFFGLSKDWRFTYFNQRAAAQMKLLGKDPERLIGKVVWDEFPGNPHEAVLRRVMSERVPIIDELYYAPLGEWVENHTYPSQDGGLVTFQRYITERKHSESALQRSQALLAEGQRISHTGSGMWIVKTGEVIWSDEMFRLYGFEPGSVTPSYETFFQLVHPNDRQKTEDAFQKFAREGGEYDTEFRLIRPDGATRHMHSVGRALRDGTGEITEVVGTVIDITERREAEDEHRKLVALVENSQDFIGLASLEGDVLYVNDAGRKIVGLNGEGGTSIFDYVMEEDRAFVAEEILTQVAKEGEWEGEISMRHFQTGIPIPMHVNVFVIKEEGTDRPLALATISRDISERKKAEQKLHQTQARLANATRLSTLGEIGASIAHEINQPLGAIVNNSNVCLKLISRRGSEEKKREVLVDIANDALRASAIITRIRALTKRSTSEKTFFPVEDLVDEVLALAHQSACKAGVSIKNMVPARLHLHADRIQLHQMLLNLVMNGIQAMSETDEKKRIMTLQAKPQKLDGKPMITISVEDCGRGFTPEEAARLFEPFFTTKSDGMGLGLAISRSIAETHGGRLWAELNTGPGTIFYCALPAHGANEAKKSRARKGVKS
jgi:PAS domain S-box-containing protein